MDRAIFDEWWDALSRVLYEQPMKDITLGDVKKYLEELHEKAERCDVLEDEIANLKHQINRL